MSPKPDGSSPSVKVKLIDNTDGAGSSPWEWSPLTTAKQALTLLELR